MSDKKIIKIENGIRYFDNGDWIDLNNIPTTKNGNFNWSNIENIKCNFKYGDIRGEVILGGSYTHKSKSRNTTMFYVTYNNFTLPFASKNFVTLKFRNLINGVNKGDYKFEIGQEIHNNKRDCIIIDRKMEYVNRKGTKYNRLNKYYKVKCLKCGYDCGEYYKKGEYNKDYWIFENNLLNNSCPCCCKYKQFVVPNINSITSNKETIWMVNYFIGDSYHERYINASQWTYNSEQKVKIRCPICGENMKESIISNIYYNKGMCCNKCSDNVSFPNKILYNICNQLLNNNIIYNYEYEFKPKWCKFVYKNNNRYGIYDGKFNIVDKNIKIIVEMDGGFHSVDNSLSGQTAEESKFIDDEKDKLAIENGYEIIRIDCNYDKTYKRFEYIKNNILNSNLSKYINFNTIDWDICYINSISNYKIMSIHDYNSGMNINDIMIKYHIKSRTTILKYLKDASEYNLCNNL